MTSLSQIEWAEMLLRHGNVLIGCKMLRALWAGRLSWWSNHQFSCHTEWRKHRRIAWWTCWLIVWPCGKSSPRTLLQPIKESDWHDWDFGHRLFLLWWHQTFLLKAQVWSWGCGRSTFSICPILAKGEDPQYKKLRWQLLLVCSWNKYLGFSFIWGPPGVAHLVYYRDNQTQSLKYKEQWSTHYIGCERELKVCYVITYHILYIWYLKELGWKGSTFESFFVLSDDKCQFIFLLGLVCAPQGEYTEYCSICVSIIIRKNKTIC